MYNRYIRNDNGSYARISQEEQPHQVPPKQEPPAPAMTASPVFSATFWTSST